ncbi:MAG TPA: hypothetical protein VHB48_02925, partial [Chitinophagaceae bacterium]|nr:hypothetical protein [Chitinophagaceae bacterium]
SKPSHIYSEEPAPGIPVAKEITPVQPVKPAAVIPVPEPVKQAGAARKPVLNIQPDAEDSIEFTFELKEDAPVQPAAAVTSFSHNAIPDMSEEEEQRRKAADRINKLRNISFNMNTNHDVTGEFDSVPAYVRRNMELFGNTLTSVENYYSRYTVKKEENNDQAQISTRNKFLDEKKPD